MKLDKDALLCWKEDLTRDGENNELLTKYTLEDESKAKVTDLVNRCAEWTVLSSLCGEGKLVEG